MKKELAKLSKMLQENRITPEDYQLLKAALHKQSIFANIENSFLINPFRKIAGVKALAWGLVLMIAMSFVGTYANIFYDGVIGYLIPLAIQVKRQPGFWLLFGQNMVACLTLSILYFVLAIFLKQKQIRWHDFFGMVALSRYPIFLSVCFTYVEEKLNPHFLQFNPAKGFEMHFGVFEVISSLLLLICLAWQIVVYFFALKEASGLTGKRLWLSFLFAILVGDVLAIWGTRLFFMM